LAVSPAFAKDTGYLFVSSEKDNNISVLDAKTFEVIKRIGTAARPRHLQFSPDRSKIYAACGDGSAIDIIDVAKLELVDRIAGIEDPELFDISGDGKTL
jgi:YVTN family beta-propeller protein